MRILAVVWIMLSLVSPASAQGYGITVFGTELISKDEVIESYSDDLRTLKELYDSDRDTYKYEKVILENILLLLGDVAYVNINLFKSYTGDYDFIIDVVETREATTRLDFRNLETNYFDDPDSLIAKWQAYEDTSFRLYRSEGV